MNIELIVIGKTDEKFINEGIEKYTARLKHYTGFGMTVVPDIKGVKNMSEAEQKRREGEVILSKIAAGDYLVLLDERGREFSSEGFSGFVSSVINRGVRRMVFVIGGPYGFSDEMYSRADDKISLSQMTFSHQMVRMIFAEQLYRAFTILRNEPYHHR